MAIDLLTFLWWAVIVGCGVGCIYLCLSAWSVRRFIDRAPSALAHRLPVTVLKPLCGADADLYENLVSLCRQDYPNFQIVCGVRDAADPAIAVVEQLRADFPTVDLALVIDGRRHGENFKVANLQNMYPSAKHDLIVIADSDMRVAPTYLAEVAGALDEPEVGLVTCLYRGISAGGMWSALASIHVNHEFLPQALAGEAVGIGAGCFGATIALHRETLATMGGFAAIENTLADDHAMGAAVRRLGRRVILSSHLVDNIISEPSLKALFQHELRWARTIRLLSPMGYAGSIVTQPVALGLIAVLLDGRPVPATALLGLALAIRAVTVRLNDRALRLRPTALWLVPFRDLLSFGVFVASFFARTVAWRDRTFRVSADGQLILDGDSPA